MWERVKSAGFLIAKGEREHELVRRKYCQDQCASTESIQSSEGNKDCEDLSCVDF